MRIFTAIFVIHIGSVLLGPIVEAQAVGDELTKIADQLKDDRENPILLMQQQMLMRSAGGAAAGATQDWRWMRRQTNLRREVTGALRTTGGQRTFGQSVELLTGQRAIDESLQLGSIGSNRAGDEQTDLLSIEDVQPVAIASHPWEQMIAGRDVTAPDIARLVPRNVLFVHMSRPSQFLDLEKILKEQSELFGDVYHLGHAVGLKGRMMKRLGIPDADVLLAGVEEMAFISEDLSFYPRTDYALIVKPKNALAEKGFEFIVGDGAIYRKVGAYLVIATHTDLIERVESAAQNSTSTMADELDYRYALLEMEARRDGLIYLSEAFIRKMTGPAYRINARRRNTILDALETLQYSVFAYRRISGQWPATVQSMADAGYIAPDSVYAMQNYSVDDSGRVVHDTWGHIWQVTPIAQVPIDSISRTEAADYERFSRGYQSFFREFFDPIGIAYSVSDQLYLHTLIMPLIDKSEYREIQSFLSGAPGEFSFFFEPDRLGAINIAAAFSVDDFLINVSDSRRRGDEVKDLTDARRAQLIYEAEQEIAREVFDEDLAPGERLLDFIGDEVFFGVGEKNAFRMSNIADIDLWFGVRLENRQRAEAFFRKLWLTVAQEFSGRRSGMFQLSTTEPLSNEYNGQKYYLLPTGFVNIYYVFFEDVFYVTISQVAMNRLIDARNDTRSEEFSENMLRGFAHVGVDHHIIAGLDLNKIAAFELGDEFNLAGHRIAEQIRLHGNTLNEALTLAQILPGYDGTLGNVGQYYRDLPQRFYGARFEAENGELYLANADGRTRLGDISASRRGSPNNVLGSSFTADDVRDRMRAFRSIVLGLSFIPEGLEVKLSIGNPDVTAPDPRYTFVAKADGGGPKNNKLAIIAVVAVLVLFILVITGRSMRRPSEPR